MLPEAVKTFLNTNNEKHSCFCLAINNKLKIVQYFGSAEFFGLQPPEYNLDISKFLPVVITEKFNQNFEIPFYNISNENVCNICFLKQPKISYLVLIDKSEIFNVTQKYQQFAHDDNISKNKFMRLAEELEKAKQKLKISNQEKATLIAMLSHEIGTPLTSIVGYSELLLKNDVKTKKGLEIINRNAVYLQQMIENTLLFGSSEAGGVQLNIEETTVHKLFNSLKATISPAAIYKQLSLQMFHKRNQKINIDIARTKQILINLLNNAVKYTEAGSVELKFSIVKDHYVFSIVDTGLGVPKELQETIFKPWERIQENSEKGAGIGLFISLKLASAIGGKLKLKYSDPEFGSIFQLIIPAQVKKEKKSIKHDKVSDSKQGQSILIIDDDQDILDLLEVMLLPTKLKIYSAINFIEAKELLESKSVKLILTDLNLGTIKATSFISEIKAHDDKLPVILMTAMPTSDIKTNYKKLGFKDIIAKPINSDMLVEIITKNI